MDIQFNEDDENVTLARLYEGLDDRAKSGLANEMMMMLVKATEDGQFFRGVDLMYQALYQVGTEKLEESGLEMNDN
ncbi:hypothetical protein [Salinibacter phage M8CC-19]|uniref:Uncharacterized protein n=2 Tax=Kryptosalinivirus M8CC19 TaxID=2560720 RepID=A0A2I6UGA3_9CAUD|nr:hypothetical protein FGG63_gp09 [Salinibacter phage M8CC-19]AUO79012.1 hypothetical protein [Salinibacter phage M8CC-19]AUO79245.1 hypothetical protein [Salinibacter phage M31CC-1]